MARQVGKVLEFTRPKVVPEVKPDISSNAVHETVVLNLFDIDPYTEQKSLVHIDLNLDQLEDSDEEE